MVLRSPKATAAYRLPTQLSVFLFTAAVCLLHPAGRAEGQGLSGTSSRPDSIRGTVVNAVTHEPVAHALVFSFDNRFATMSDDQGRFEFALPEPKRQSSGDPQRGVQSVVEANEQMVAVAARKPGYLSEEESGGAVPVGRGQQDVTIPLLPEALVIGRILLSASDYLTRMPVHLYRRVPRNGQEHWDDMRTVTSRADGPFLFAELLPGEYKLVTQEMLDRDPVTFDPQGQLFGYTPVYYPSAPDFAAAETIRLAPGAIFQANLSPVRRPYYPVRIPVVNASTGLQVEVWAQGQPSPGYSLAYRVQNGAIEGSLPDGTYIVQAISFNNGAMSGTAMITVAGAPANNVTMTLQPNASISVNVQEELEGPYQWNQTYTQQSAEGVQQFTVTRRRPSYLQLQLVPIEPFGNNPGAWLQGPTGPDDEALIIPNVRPGKYRVLAHTGVGYIASLTIGGSNLLRVPLQVDTGSALSAMQVTVRDDGAVLEGTVDGVHSAAMSGTAAKLRPETLTVYLVPAADSTSQFQSVWVGPDGHFATQQVAPGTYRVFALDHQDPDVQFASEEALARFASQTQTIEVAAGQKTSLHLSLIRKAP